jgi:predicted transcriptional regulator
MSKQIAVRLPDELVAFVDGLAEREDVSRAAIVTRALERERRRAVAARDVEILTSHGSAGDLHELAEHLADQPIDLD